MESEQQEDVTCGMVSLIPDASSNVGGQQIASVFNFPPSTPTCMINLNLVIVAQISSLWLARPDHVILVGEVEGSVADMQKTKQLKHFALCFPILS
jgi:hypothetical protein